jgi:hypothetical protein
MSLAHRHLSRNEIVLSLAVLAVLGWMFLSLCSLGVEHLRIKRTLRFLRRIEGAVAEYQRDTGRYPVHFADYDPTVHPDLQNLTHAPPLKSGLMGTTWKGPYLEELAAHNAWGGLIHLHYSTRQFDLDGDGRADTSGSNSYLVLSAIPRRAAARLDILVDGRPDPGAGRLTCSDAAGGRQSICFLIAD